MTRALLLTTPLLAALFLSGCLIDLRADPDCAPWCGDDLWVTCDTDSDCWEGEYCEAGYCVYSWFCDYGAPCPRGMGCDDRDTCVPDSHLADCPSTPGDCSEECPDQPDDDRQICGDDADCLDGFCAPHPEGEGRCVPTGECESDSDCADYGRGLGCDERGICAPATSACADGDCGCETDAECTDGRLCIDSLCTDPEAVCFFDFECGAGAVCLDNACHETCDAECPSGQLCDGGLCMTPAAGLGECVYASDCGDADSFACVNATCHATCELAADCQAGETCRSGSCRADTAPVRSCGGEAGECDTDMTCHRGLCRMPCAASINCGDEMSVCGDAGFCLYPSEIEPACTRATDCAAGETCLSNTCTNLNSD